MTRGPNISVVIEISRALRSANRPAELSECFSVVDFRYYGG